MAELATLRIHRPSRLLDSGILMIEVDGREVGRLRKGQDLVTHVESGRRNVRVRVPLIMGMGRWLGVGGPILDLVVAPGEEVRLETKVRRDAWSSNFELVRTDGATALSSTWTAAQSASQVLGVTEMHRSEEPIGTETRRIENTSGSTKLTRTIRVTREWSRTVSLDRNSSRSVTGGAQIGPDWLALRASIEQSLART